MSSLDTAVLQVDRPSQVNTQENGSSSRKDDMSNGSTSFEGSVIASPSIESFSTLPDQEDLEFSLESGDLQVRVDNPQKHLDTLETYITFRISTRTTRIEFHEAEYTVRRRYNDFVWLRQKLVEAFPTHLVPPLPAKHTLLAQLDRYSKDFVMARMAMLHRFLTRVVAHPVLSYNSSLHIFLTSKPSEFQIHRKSGQGILSRVTDSFQNLTTSYMVRQKSPEFDSVREYVTSLGEKLGQLDKIGQRILKERLAYHSELQQFHPIFTLWSTSEPELCPLFLSIAAALERNVQSQQRNLLDTFAPNFEQPLKEYLLYVESVKEALYRRDSLQIEYELVVDELNKKRTEKEQLLNGEVPPAGASSALNLWKNTAETRDGKLGKLTQAIPNLVRQAEVNQDKVQCANENLRSDLDRWHSDKKKDLRSLLLSMANQQIQYYQECLSSWEQVLPECKGKSQTGGGVMPHSTDNSASMMSSAASFAPSASMMSSAASSAPHHF